MSLLISRQTNSDWTDPYEALRRRVRVEVSHTPRERRIIQQARRDGMLAYVREALREGIPHDSMRRYLGIGFAKLYVLIHEARRELLRERQ